MRNLGWVFLLLCGRVLWANSAATVEIELDHDDNIITGTWIGRQAVVTVGHAEKEGKIKRIGSDGRLREKFTNWSSSGDQDNDIAVLIVDGISASQIAKTGVAYDGETLTIISRRDGVLTQRKAKVISRLGNRIRTEDVGYRVENPGFVQGDSGAGAFNSQGALVGVLFGCNSSESECGVIAIQSKANYPVFVRADRQYPQAMEGFSPSSKKKK